MRTVLQDTFRRFLIVIALTAVILGAAIFLNQSTPQTAPCTIPLGNIAGTVLVYSTHTPASGLTIYQACSDGTVLGSTRTDTTGFFSFHASGSKANQEYLITVNGAPSQLGHSVQNATWGQWAGSATTNSTGYAKIRILIEPAASVQVPLASFFSNSTYARLNYTTFSKTAFGLNFAVNTPNIASGYSGISWLWGESQSWDYGGAPWYDFVWYSAVTLWCDSGSFCLREFGGFGIRVSGIVQRWNGQNVQSSSSIFDYVNPLILTENYVDFKVSPGAFSGDNLTMTGNMTWSRANRAPFSISFVAYGTVIDLSTTVSVASGNPNLVWSVHNTSGSTICLREYSTQNTAMKTVGPEFHLWQIPCNT